MRNRHGRVLSVDGLWAIAFGNDDAAGASNALYFTAGPDDEAHGLFGGSRPRDSGSPDRWEPA